MLGPSVDIWSAPRWRVDFEPNLGLWLRSDLGVTLNSTTTQLIADGDMEAGGTASWPAIEATASKQGSAHGGAQCLRVTATAGAGVRTPRVYQAILQVGKEYRIQGWARSDGTEVPIVRISPTDVWTGTNSTSWQPFDVVATATHVWAMFGFGVTGPAGAEYVEFDDIIVTRTTAEDVAALADQGSNGRDVLQATPARQMAYSASGGPNNHPYIEGDGVDDYLKGTWVQAQPITRWVVAMPSVTAAGAGTICDGGALNSSRLHISGADALSINAGAALGPAAATETDWHYIRSIYNGASSSVAVDGGTPVAGAAGAAAADGLIIGANGTPADYGDCRIAEIIELAGVATATQTNDIEHYISTRYDL